MRILRSFVNKEVYCKWQEDLQDMIQERSIDSPERKMAITKTMLKGLAKNEFNKAVQKLVNNVEHPLTIEYIAVMMEMSKAYFNEASLETITRYL